MIVLTGNEAGSPGGSNDEHDASYSMYCVLLVSFKLLDLCIVYSGSWS